MRRELQDGFDFQTFDLHLRRTNDAYDGSDFSLYAGGIPARIRHISLTDERDRSKPCVCLPLCNSRVKGSGAADLGSRTPIGSEMGLLRSSVVLPSHFLRRS